MRAMILGLAMLAAAGAAQAQQAGLTDADFQALASKAQQPVNRFERDRQLGALLARTDLSSDQRVQVLWSRGVNNANGTGDVKAAVRDYEAAVALKPSKPETAARLAELAAYARGQLAASEGRLAQPFKPDDYGLRFSDLIAAGRAEEAVTFVRETYAADKRARDSKVGFRAMHYQKLIDMGWLCRGPADAGISVTWKANNKDDTGHWCGPPKP